MADTNGDEQNNDPPPAPGVPEIRIRATSVPGDEVNKSERSDVPVTGSEAQSDQDDAVSRDEVFVEDPYTQGYGQLADSESPFGIKVNLPGVHEPSGLEDEDDNKTTVTDPDAVSPTLESQEVVGMDIDNNEEGEDSGGVQGYQQMMDVDEDEEAGNGDKDAKLPPEPAAGYDTSGVSAKPASSGWESLGSANSPEFPPPPPPQAASSPMLDIDFDMFDSQPKSMDSVESDSTTEIAEITGHKKPPPRPRSPSNRPVSPAAPPRPVSPAATLGQRSVSPARPERPRSRSPARPPSPMARSKSPARPPPPKSPQNVGGGGGDGKKTPPARPPSRPPPPGVKKPPAPSPTEFEQEESELVEINKDAPLPPPPPPEEMIPQSASEGDLLSPESYSGDVSDGSVSQEGEGKIKITLPKHQMKSKSKSAKKTTTVPAPASVTSDSDTGVTAPAASTGSWQTFDDSPPGTITVNKQFSLGSDSSEKSDGTTEGVRKVPPPRPAPPSNVPSRPPPPSAAARSRAAAQKKEDNGHPAAQTKAAKLAKESKEKKSKFISPKKIMGKRKKHKGDDFEDILKGTGESLPEEKSAAFAAFEEMQARISGTVTATQGRLGDLGKEMEATIAHIEATNTPWTVMVGGTPDAPTKITSPLDDDIGGVPALTDPKAGWEGFGDDNFANMTTDTANKLAAINVTPIPSPKHPPVPPNNSRRNSGDEHLANSKEVDLLGLSSGGHSVAEVNEAVNTDLLGLMGSEVAETAGDTLTNQAGDASPSCGDEIFKTGTDENGGTTHDPYIDAFLGLGEGGTDAAGASGNDDDPFGLGTAGAETVELSIDELKEDIDPFMLPPEVNAIAAGENITEAPEPEPETTGDDFLKMAAEVAAKEAENERKERDPNDFGGFGTPQVAERKVEVITTEAKKSGKSVVIKSVARPRPRKQVELASFIPPPPQKEEIKEQNDLIMISPGSDEFDPRGDFEAEVRPMPDNADSIWASEAQPKGENPFKADVDAKLEAHKAANNPFVNTDADVSTAEKQEEETKEEVVKDEFDIFGPVDSTPAFNPFATIVQDDAVQGDDFDPFATIHGDDAFVDVNKKEGEQKEDGEDKEVTSPRINPFDKEPPLDEKFASFEPKAADEKANEPLFSAFTEPIPEPEEELEPLPPYREPFTGDGWHMLLRQPAKKKLTGNRYWKTVYVRIVTNHDIPTIRVFNNDKDPEIFHDLPLQPCYQMCDLGLQQYDQYGKCHTAKIQYVFYRERVGVKADRITPTLGDIARVRDLKSLKDLVHKPKATMILDHAPQASELLKFGSLDYDSFRSFIWTVEDAFFSLQGTREIKAQNYTKDEITIDIVDEYYLEIDKDCHITFHKARVRAFCLAFLTGNPKVELGMNDRRRKGKEIVGRKDIIPIRTDEWIRMEDPEFHCSVDNEEYEKTKVIKFIPLDACHYELMRFRTRPKKNRELPLQFRVQQVIGATHMEIRADVIIPGYYSNSRRAQQTPCEDICIVFPIPEPWIYMFRVEKRFKYGSVKSTTRKAGKIKGLERLTQMAQGVLPPSLIEVSSGSAKYENVFHGIVWRIARLPERNEGAYKQHFFKLRVDLGPHDVMPESFEKMVKIQYQMPNSMVSRAQVRSIGVSDVEDPPDRWVHHLAKYEYVVEMEAVEQTRTSAPEHVTTIEEPTTPNSDEEDTDDEVESPPKEAPPAVDTSSSSSDDD